MQQVGARQRRYGRRHATAGLRRWLVLVLVLVFAVSGLAHVGGNDHVAHAATHTHGLAFTSHDAGGEPCCPEYDGQQPSGTKDCSATSGCPLCAPIGSQAAPALPDAEPLEIRPEPAQLGCAPPPQLRPPKLIQNA